MQFSLTILSSILMLSVASVSAGSPVQWSGSTEIASGPGERGPWQQNESHYHYVDDPSVVIDKYGNSAVVWVDQSRKDIFFQRVPADSTKPVSEAINVSRSPATFSWLPRIAVAPDAPSEVFILWQEIIFSGGSHGGDIMFARSGDGGTTFSQPINVSQSIGGDGKGRINAEVWHNGSLDLIAGKNGRLYAAWTDYEGTLWFAHSSNGGQSFSAPRQIAGGNQRPARAPSLALAPDGGIYLAWTVGEDDGADIHLAKSFDGGAIFSNPQRIAPSKTYSDAPKIAVDASGVLHLVYAESDGGPFARYHVRYTRSVDGGRHFDAPRNISRTLSKSIISAAFPGLAVTEINVVYVVWENYYDVRQSPRGLGMTVSQDGGKTFSAAEIVEGSADETGGGNGSHQGLLMKKLAANNTGTVAIVNSSMKQGSHSRVWLIRGQVRR